MTSIHRQGPPSGAVIGIAAENEAKQVNIHARQAVIICTGGSTTNINFRRVFDPRLTEEYCGVAGMPWSEQDGSGEIAGMAIAASLWGLFNNTGEFGSGITKPGTIGGQYGTFQKGLRPPFPRRAMSRPGCALRYDGTYFRQTSR